MAQPRRQELLEARVHLAQVAARSSLEELLQATLDTVERLTGSEIGFFHFVEPDQKTLSLQTWSTNTLARMCTAEARHTHYAIDQAGVWVDCFHARAPVIHNDMASLAHRKGMPEGHARVVRELVVPTLRHGMVTSIIGVGNKPTDYDQDDVDTAATLVSLAMDLVDRMRAEAALSRSEARFRDLFDRMAQGALYFDATGQVLSANRAARRILGVTTEELLQHNIGRPRWEMVREDGSPLPNEESPAMAALLRGEEVRDRVVGLKTGRRGLVWVLASAIAEYRDGSDRPSSAFVTFEDITDRRRAEEERLRHLEHEQRLLRAEGLSALAGGIAHDFNNILTAVLGFAEGARALLPDESPAQAELAQVLSAAHRAADLSRQMLALSGKRLFAPARVALAEVIEVARAELLPTIPANVRLVVEPPTGGEIPVAMADPPQLSRLLANLVTNSVEALERHGGTITIRQGLRLLEHAELAEYADREALPPGRYAWISVSDDGPGMEAATLARIFDPFFSTRFVGRGLGLPVALGIARAHAGSLRVRSAPGEGTTTMLIVPAVDPLPESSAGRLPIDAATESAEVHAPPARRAVLVVDDEDLVLRLARRTLARAGYEVLIAFDGREALAVYAENRQRIALVILDLTMPVLDGDATLRELRSLDPEVPVIISSGYPVRDVEARFAGRDVTAFLGKPYLPEQLRSQVQALLG